MRRSPRLIVAAIILMFGLFSFLSKRDTNPVTGETQYVSLSPEQEIALGLQSAPQMAAEMGGLDPDAALQERIAALGNKLVENSFAGEAPYKFQFHVLADPNTVNAFALPGGPVFITRALLDRLENEAQVAGVLGHEIGHVIARHASEHIAKSNLANSVVGAVAVAGSDEYGRGQQAAMMAAFVAQMAQLRYGRNDELESDKYGVRIMSETGYDPRAMLGVMKILQEASGGSRQTEFMSTHPDPGNRLQKIEETIRELYPQGVPETLTTGAAFRK
jgi:beta-barrel assembly-enhancing protease